MQKKKKKKNSKKKNYYYSKLALHLRPPPALPSTPPIPLPFPPSPLPTPPPEPPDPEFLRRTSAPRHLLHSPSPPTTCWWTFAPSPSPPCTSRCTPPPRGAVRKRTPLP